ncbi:MAG TPA: LysR substrate-binding domain-containing protein [Solirubrobacteraceae bacterium]|nr:LysR substrate-binding domain-containing protein [Solirubrobacteraceae bacterium]
MELRHLRYFVAVAEELHFHRAAARLHMSQPPLSQQIRALETELGVELLRRNRRRVELTEAGAAFLGEARGILASVQQAGDLARRVARGEIGKLSVGFVGSAMYATVPEILRAFRERHPDVELQLRPFPTAPQLEALRDGRVDVGFLRPPVQRAGLEIETIQRETIVVALPTDHPLAGSSAAIAIGQLRNETFVLLARTESPGVYDSLALTLSELAGNPRAVQEADDMQTLIGLVSAGIGVALVPISVSLLERPGVVYRRLSGRAPTVELALAWRSGPVAPVVAAFLAVARALPEGRLSGRSGVTAAE